MEEKLTDEQISTICMFMRIVDLFNNNPNIVNEIPDLVENFKILKKNISKIMELLTDEQKDELLEEHKIQWEEVMRTTKKSKKR